MHQKTLRTLETALMVGLAIAAAALPLNAQTAAGPLPRASADRLPQGFYLSLQAPYYFGFSFPTKYILDTPWPTDPQQAFVLPAADSDVTVAAKPTVGLSAGYALNKDRYFGSIEISYSQTTAAGGPESFEEILRLADGDRDTIRAYNQSARKFSIIDATARAGIFPLRSLPIGIYVSAGVGYSTKSYQSPASAYIESQGYSIEPLLSGYFGDLGNYEGAGTWSRGQLSIEYGGGLEWLVTAHIGLKIDFKFITGTIKRKEIIYGAIPVEATVRINYTLANRLLAALSYYF